MKVFKDQTDPGNEKAFKRGRTVPDGAVNLAYFKAPVLSPDKNVVIVDTSKIIEENNLDTDVNRKKIYYANALGILEDQFGSSLIEDEYPVISNVFLEDESNHDPAAFSPSDILSFAHISRYFHVDFISIARDGILTNYKTAHIKVIDKNGRDYVDEDGNPRYKIKVVRAPGVTLTFSGDQALYRVHAFVDTDQNEDLYLTYNKMELHNGTLVNQDVGHKEILNPQPYLHYVPEESDVIEPSNRSQNIFSSKPVALKEEILGIQRPSLHGYKVFVPEKAIGDPRIFQLFRWRVNCDFTKPFTADEESDTAVLNCGIVVTNAIPTSFTPYALYNLQISSYNRQKIQFVNPLQTPGSDQKQASYWYVNFDTVSVQDLSRFDLLLWSPNTAQFDFSAYTGKIDYFTRILGKTLFFDSNDYTVPSGLPGLTVTSPVDQNGKVNNDTSTSGTGYVHVSTFDDTSGNTEYYSGLLGGWDFGLPDYSSLSYLQTLYENGKTHYISSSLGYDNLLTAQDQTYVPAVNSTVTVQTVTAATNFSGSTTVTAVAPSVPLGGVPLKVEVSGYVSWNTNATNRITVSGPGVDTFATGTGVLWVTGGATVGEAATIGVDTGVAGATYTATTTAVLGQITNGGINVTTFYKVVTTTNGGAVLGTVRPITIKKDTYSGRFIISTAAHLYSCSALFNNNTLVDANNGSSIRSDYNYATYLSSSSVQGAMKFLFNVALIAAKGKLLRHTEQLTTFASSWTISSNWHTSWVINAANDGLTDDEKDKYSFSFLPRDINNPTPVWQRKLTSDTCKKLIDGVLTPELQTIIDGAVRHYSIEVTNQQVSVPTTLGDESTPYAWTTAYTPNLVVPPELRAYAIREEEIQGDYGSGQYLYRTYPPKPYAAQTQFSYLDTTTTTTSTVHPVTIPWTATGTATQTIFVTEETPPSTATTTSSIEISWLGQGQYSNGRISGQNPYLYAIVADNIFMRFWEIPGVVSGPGHDLNGGYWDSNAWAYMGMTERYAQGVTGEVIVFVQDAMNFFNDLGYFASNQLLGGYLALDGVFGPRTAAAITKFQQTFNAKSTDGVLEAETWALIGGQIIRSGRREFDATDYRRFYEYPYRHMVVGSISDGGASSYSKRSNINGPSMIYEDFHINFLKPYKITSIIIIPFLEGPTNTEIVTQITLTNNGVLQANLDNLNMRVASDQYVNVPVGPYMADHFSVSIMQDQPSFNNARYLGVRDLRALAEVDTITVIPGTTKVVAQTLPYPLTASGQLTFTSTGTMAAYAQITNDPGNLSNVQWTNVNVPGNLGTATINSAGLVRITPNAMVISANTVTTDLTYTSSHSTFGTRLPATDGSYTYYSKNLTGHMNPIPETGWVSKVDGLKLLCNANGTPAGFDFNVPTAPNTGVQRDFLNISVNSFSTDPTVVLGFYDVSRNEFILNTSGHSDYEMAYAEYVRRGPQNVYIAAVTTYEYDKYLPFPLDENASKLPFKWVMPLYGVYRRAGSKISLEPLPPNLGVTDIWPVAIRTGKFSRNVTIRPSFGGQSTTLKSGPLTTFLGSYQKNVESKVLAFYSIPEAALGGWSTLYGPPYADVIDEHPLILDDTTIQVRQAPIFMEKQPTQLPSLADPMRPIFTVYQRAGLNSSWVQLGLSDIADYNVSTGEIVLVTPLEIDDPNLFKVTYTSERRNYYFKGYDQINTVNLNPYPGYSTGLIGKPIYIYILPDHVVDSNYVLISASVQTRTIRFTTNPNIFDPLMPEYDPLAVELGVVYISTAFDVKDIVMIDARRRGGGIKDAISNSEAERIANESSMYWDINYATGSSYQKGGFALVRLPAGVKADFTDQDIDEVVRRNITAGVQYDIEFT